MVELMPAVGVVVAAGATEGCEGVEPAGDGGSRYRCAGGSSWCEVEELTWLAVGAVAVEGTGWERAVCGAAEVAGSSAAVGKVAAVVALEGGWGVRPSRTACSCWLAMSADQRISRVWKCSMRRRVSGGSAT